ncbi:MAG: TIGR01244 family sulfur transferase [Asticcacaulis sp.]
MTIRPLSDQFHVASQLAPADIPGLAAAGYKTIVCMRPDHEVTDQPLMTTVKAATLAQGLAFHFLPVLSGAVTEAQAAALADLLAHAEGPVLAYCASGNRAALAFGMAYNAG